MGAKNNLVQYSEVKSLALCPVEYASPGLCIPRRIQCRRQWVGSLEGQWLMFLFACMLLHLAPPFGFTLVNTTYGIMKNEGEQMFMYVVQKQET